MPSHRDVPCAECGELMWRGKGCLPEGKATCRPCRKLRREARPAPVPRPQGISRKGRTCEACSALFDANCARQRTCSRACGQLVRKPTAPRPPRPQVARPPAWPSSRVFFRACHVCAALFTTKGAAAKYCSAQCRVARCGLSVKELYGAALAQGLTRGQRQHWYTLLVAWLRERDGDECYLCSESIDFDLRSGPRGSDLGRSIDHVMPRSKGGSNDPSNLRLAHWGCNRNKRATMPESPMAA